MTLCYICPHRCGVDRPETMSSSGTFGSCGCGMKPIVARAGLHMWEEPCISGTRGSGTVFLAAATCIVFFAKIIKSVVKASGKKLLYRICKRFTMISLHRVLII